MFLYLCFRNENNLLVNCSSIDKLKIGDKLGHGWQKEVYAGEIYGRKVVVKVILYQGAQYKMCRDKSKSTEFCYNFSYLAALNEIVLNYQLKHRGIVKLMGYCVKDVHHTPNPHDPILKRGVLTVFELGRPFKLEKTLNSTGRLQLAFDLADVLDYLEYSPIGSVYSVDLRPSNLVIIDGHLKISDMEGSFSKEPRCGNHMTCSYGVKCMEGECIGSNARAMMSRAKPIFQALLKPSHSDRIFKKNLTTLYSTLHKESISAAQLKSDIKSLLEKSQKLVTTND